LLFAVAAALSGLAVPAAAQVRGLPSVPTRVSLDHLMCPRIADPKLEEATIPISYVLQPPGVRAHVAINVTQDGRRVGTIFSEEQTGSDLPRTFVWDGRLPSSGGSMGGNYIDPGSYSVEVIAGASNLARVEAPLAIVRLGITEIEAQPTSGNDEWQMVYFRKGTTYAFYATPAIHEYLNVARVGELADLDLDSGDPRPPSPLWTATDSPVLDNGQYDEHGYNYPVCYLNGSRPTFEVTFGGSCVSNTGTATGVGYPVPGYQIRCVATDPTGVWQSPNRDIRPAGKAVFVGSALVPGNLTREDRSITWTWQFRPTGQNEWNEIDGRLVTDHRFYMTVGVPLFATTDGTQYAGPWVETAEYAHQWRRAYGSSKTGEAALVDIFMKGFFGQNGYLPTAIEGVCYDCPSMGGDGGASHYYGGTSVQLSRLLNAHANGKFVNCSDVASSTSTMLGMLGVQHVQMLRLGSMRLRAIWGIGTPDYTVDLWGNGNHGFSYHHIITRDGGDDVSDSCMWLDEDGDPDNLPGTPGYNADRPWNGTNGYEELSAKGNVTKSLDPLPKLK
jgi:hypothetical protein